MNYINNITQKHNYSYFDQYDQLQTKQLNIFQCFVRKAFGYYAETHLSNVVKKAYLVTLNDQFQTTPKKQQELLKLIAKAKSLYGYYQSYVKLPSCNLPCRKELNIGVHYDIKKPENGGTHYKISSIDFKLAFSRNNRVQKTYDISIFKNKSQQVVVHLPYDLFYGSSEDTEASINRKLNSIYVETINDLLAKVLNDSAKMANIQYYASDYRWIYHGLGDSLFKQRPSPNILNTTQETEMKKLGWMYQNQFSEQGTLVVLDLKRVYLLKKETAENNQNLKGLGFKQQLSMDFAASFLETQTREY